MNVDELRDALVHWSPVRGYYEQPIGPKRAVKGQNMMVNAAAFRVIAAAAREYLKMLNPPSDLVDLPEDPADWLASLGGVIDVTDIPQHPPNAHDV